jgi:Pyruvate/2-oxoacid:ferredoxin oxidoreductase gamma subunit
MFLGTKTIRERIASNIEKALKEGACNSARESMEEWLNNKDIGEGTRERAEKLEVALQGCNGVFVLNTIWSIDELDKKLPATIKKYIAENNINFYIINAIKIAQEIGLGGRINMIMQSAFFKVANIIPVDEAIKYLKQAVVTSYGKKKIYQFLIL